MPRMLKIKIKLRWALFVTYTIIQSITSSEMCSLHLTHQSAHTLGAVDTAAPGEQLEVRCLAQGSHLSRGQFLPEPRFEPTTSGCKSNALSTRPPLPRGPNPGTLGNRTPITSMGGFCSTTELPSLRLCVFFFRSGSHVAATAGLWLMKIHTPLFVGWSWKIFISRQISKIRWVNWNWIGRQLSIGAR